MTRTAIRRAAPFAEEVAHGLTQSPKRLPPKYFYDALGSALFDAICRLPWYPITRAETGLLAKHARDILGGISGGSIVELGCGNGEKLEILARSLRDDGGIARIHLVDISWQALQQTRDRIEPLELPVVLHEGSYEDGLQDVLAARDRLAPMLILFLGSNIGNYEADDAAAFVRTVASAMLPGDVCIVGTDLVKPEEDLLLAYDDPLGVTAAFNRNLLVRMNAELGADFDLDGFVHRALWNAEHSRVEMHLVSTRRQDIRIPGARLTIHFDEGETIWTESSYKYAPADARRLGTSSGLTATDQWIDDSAGFALTRFVLESSMQA